MGEINQRKKEIIQQYKERKVTGGVYSITNTISGKKHLVADVDLNACRNRFEFSKMTSSCMLSMLQKEWREYGAAAFIFEIIEEIEKKAEQSPKEFKDDLNCLLDMWKEKLNI